MCQLSVCMCMCMCMCVWLYGCVCMGGCVGMCINVYVCVYVSERNEQLCTTSTLGCVQSSSFSRPAASHRPSLPPRESESVTIVSLNAP